jgi:hypothetical protein
MVNVAGRSRGYSCRQLVPHELWQLLLNSGIIDGNKELVRQVSC